MSIRPVLTVFAAVAVACAPPSNPGNTRDSNVITREELSASKSLNAYDAIKNLRPNFLRARGTNTFDPVVSTEPTVYVDGQRFGDITNLRSMSVDLIAEIRLLRASDATIKYGTNHTTGVIEVTTRK